MKKCPVLCGGDSGRGYRLQALRAQSFWEADRRHGRPQLPHAGAHRGGPVRGPLVDRLLQTPMIASSLTSESGRNP